MKNILHYISFIFDFIISKNMYHFHVKIILIIFQERFYETKWKTKLEIKEEKQEELMKDKKMKKKEDEIIERM